MQETNKLPLNIYILFSCHIKTELQFIFLTHDLVHAIRNAIKTRYLILKVETIFIISLVLSHISLPFGWLTFQLKNLNSKHKELKYVGCCRLIVGYPWA
jgi:hypothetical protein